MIRLLLIAVTLFGSLQTFASMEDRDVSICSREVGLQLFDQNYTVNNVLGVKPIRLGEAVKNLNGDIIFQSYYSGYQFRASMIVNGELAEGNFIVKDPETCLILISDIALP